jgi:hypothetical protein
MSRESHAPLIVRCNTDNLKPMQYPQVITVGFFDPKP